MTPAEIDSLIIALEDVLFWHQKLNPNVPREEVWQSRQLQQMSWNQRDATMRLLLEDLTQEREKIYG